MAARSVLKAEITCPLCLGIFEDPKKLPCGHIYCKACLENMASRNVTAAIPCPKCRKLAQLPDGDVGKLPPAVHVYRLVDVYQQLPEPEEDKTSCATGRSTQVARRQESLPSTESSLNEEWIDISYEDILASQSAESASDWQRMRRVRERARVREQPPQGGSEQAVNFSQFFAQLKTECKNIAQGVKEGIRQFKDSRNSKNSVNQRSVTRSRSHESRSPPIHRTPPRDQAAASLVTPGHQASQVSQNSFSTGQNDGSVASLLRAKNQEIGELHQELQAKRHQEHQHKQKVDSLERQMKELSDQSVILGHQQEMEHQRKTCMLQGQIRKEQNKLRQMEMEMETVRRQLQDVNVRQSQVQVTPTTTCQASQGSGIHPSVLQLPNTLNYRLIARHPQILCKVTDYAKSHGVQVNFSNSDSSLQAAICGSSDAVANVQTYLSLLDHELQGMIEMKYLQSNCTVLPLLLESGVSKALAEIELKYHIEICIADNSGKLASIRDFIQLLQSEYSDKLLMTCDLQNISVPDVHINNYYNWKAVNGEGGIVALPKPVNQYLNNTFFSEKKDEATFEYNDKNYTASVSLMHITEIETGVQMALDVDFVPPSWSYAISDSDFVAHELQSSSDLENMFRYGGASITLAGSRHTLDLCKMHQIDLETGHRVAVMRDPTLERQEAPQYIVTFAIRGLQEGLEPVTRVIRRTLDSFCTKVNFTRNLLPTIFKNWQDIILVQMLNTARQYCLKIEQYEIKKSEMTIHLKGAKDVLDKVLVLLKEQSLEFQHHVITTQQPKLQNSYPPEWEPQKHDFELVSVHHGSSEWQSVEELMKLTLAEIRIFQLQRIQHQQLWDKYALEMKHMSERNSGNVNEQQLFHGTRNTNPNVIIKGARGIDFRYSSRDYQLRWGTGAYFAVNASYSNNYCYTVRGSGLKQLLLVKVLTGRSYDYGSRKDPQLTKPPPLSQGSHVLYDTVKGYTNGSYVYVVYDHDRAYPAYLITYLC